MENCIFCKIVQKEIPNYTVYEDASVLAFLDITPQVKGHTVVIPKVHAQVLTELESAQLGPLLNGVNEAMRRITTILSPDGFNVGWNHGAAGGQVVPHVHIHIFPRWLNDGGSSVHSIVQNPSPLVGDVARLFQS